MSIRGKLQSLASNGFVRAVSILVGGTAVAHLVMMATLPIVTRLYSPNDFAILALVTAITSIIAVAASLRFDIAIPIAEEDEEAINILALAMFSSVVVSAILAVIAYILSDQIVLLLGRPDFRPYVWAVPIAVFFSSAFSTLQNWFVRQKSFRKIAETKITQAGSAAVAQLGLGLVNPSPTGLLLGFVINSGAGCLGLGYRLLRADMSLIRLVSGSRMSAAFFRHIRFPKFSAPEASLNSASIFLPLVLISSLTSGPEAGFIILAMQVMQAPMSLIGSAIAQVYLSRAPEELRAGTLGDFTATIFGGLLRSGVGPIIFAGLVAPTAFAVVFGAEWTRAGQLVMWMTPWFATQFLASPISMALHVTGHQPTALALQLFGLILRAGAVMAAAKFDPAWLGEVYALSGFVFYGIYLLTVLRLSGCRREQAALELRRHFPVILCWILLGLCLAYVATRFLGL